MKSLAVLVGVFLVGIVAADDKDKTPLASKPDRVLKKGDWELHITYRAKGSRSEGQNGQLFHKGKKVPPGKEGDEKETDLGMMKFWGTRAEPLWTPTGWNFKDRSKHLFSTQKSPE